MSSHGSNGKGGNWGANFTPTYMSPARVKAWRQAYEQLSPRHVNAARWTMDYGWRIDPAVLRDYLKPEQDKALDG